MSNEMKDWLREEEEDEDENAVYRLTEAACMQLTLKDFNIEVALPMAKAIMENFMELMVRQGYIGENDDKDE